MTTSSGASDHIAVIYFDADSVSELFSIAARWAAENDGGFAIEALTLKDLNSPDEPKHELAIFYEPQ